MKKAIRILSVISIILSGLAVLMAVMIPVFWEETARIFTVSEEIINSAPMLPVGSMIYLMGNLIIIFVLLLSSGIKRTNVAAEIIGLVFLMAVFPFFKFYIDMMQNIVMARFGAVNMAVLGITSSAISFCNGLSGIGVSLSFVAIGMRFSEKSHIRRQGRGI